MQRICPPHLLLVGWLPDLRRKIGRVLAVQPAKRTDGLVAGLLLRLVQRLEEPTADDLEGLDAARRRPRRLDAAEDLLETPERIPALLIADFGTGLRQRADDDRALNRCRGLG